MISLLATTPATTGPAQYISAFGPYLAGIAALVAAWVSIATRKDKKVVDHTTLADNANQTAFTGLTEAYDRCDAERREAQRRVDELEDQVQKLVEENFQLRLELNKPRTPKRRTP